MPSSAGSQGESIPLLPRGSGEPVTDDAELRATLMAKEGSSAPRYLGMAKLLVVAYTGIMIYMLDRNGGFADMETNPMLGPDSKILNACGANNAAEIKYNDEYWRLITPMFLHAGLIHLVLNCYIQWTIGSYLEQVWGRSVTPQRCSNVPTPFVLDARRVRMPWPSALLLPTPFGCMPGSLLLGALRGACGQAHKVETNP